LLNAATTQADQARALADSAQSRDDWTLVVSLWEEAIALLDAIPEDAPEHAAAQQNKSAYQENLATAQQAATIPVDTTPRLTTPQPESAESAETTATASGATAAAPEPTTELADVTAEVALANHLTQSGARMYAAYWCSYCERQQQLFGAAAVQQLEIIECDPRGENPQVDRCRAANISGFPTWEINGQQYPGLQSLDRLANLSGYDGPRDFSN
jgi:chemotaxis protein histidine kinase CheA